jgi:trehalose-6-phosphate synthase
LSSASLALGVRARFQQFVHVPRPAAESRAFLPADTRRSICAGLLADDVVGFQTPTSVRHFLATLLRRAVSNH